MIFGGIRMKRFVLSMLFSLSLMIGITGCLSSHAKNQETTSRTEKQDVIKVVSTIFPPYDWVREVIGDSDARFELTLLLDNGVDLHSYQPTAEDMTTIAESDLFIYVGGESDAWVGQALKAVPDSTTKVINLMEILGDKAKEEEIVEGMQEEDDHEDSTDKDGDEEDHLEEHEGDDQHGENDHHEHESEIDEHVWLSLRNAQQFVDAIATTLSELDSEHKENYEANAKAYNQKLDTLDQAYQKAVDGAKYRTVLFGDRFPFRYMVDDYGLDYYAAFVGCSAETEASFETVAFLADKVNALHLPIIYVIEHSDKTIANTILSNTKDRSADIGTMNSMQSVTKKMVEEGTTYIQQMEDNLTQLKKGLNGE